ncbi:MAG: PA-phosphatase [Chitinophagaceae bacterium]|nr:PA-phosphatase [Chitinophagaceae bacterium]
MKKIFILFTCLFILKSSNAQDSVNVLSQDTLTSVQIHESANNVQVNTVTQTNETISKYPYKTSFKKDAPVIGLGVGLSFLGFTLIQNKKDLTLADLATKTKDKIPSFDRGNAGFYSDKINKDSYVPFYAAFAMPVAMLMLNKNERRDASSILIMYVESLSITSALFTLAAGAIDRSRPLVYGPSKAPDNERIKAKNQRSFYAGHTAASATGTFFAAKVFSDLNPGSKAKPFVWVIAAAIPAVVGYMRYKSGYHFLSDNILGYVLGAASGILIPEWHKTKAYKNISFIPQVGKGFKGLSFVYNIK